MAYQTGDSILDDHYNGFADDNSPNNINKILGTGNGNYGYGQTNTISTVSAGDTVAASQWNTLLNRMIAIGDHQGTNMTTADSGQLTAFSTQVEKLHMCGTYQDTHRMIKQMNGKIYSTPRQQHLL